MCFYTIQHRFYFVPMTDILGLNPLYQCDCASCFYTVRIYVSMYVCLYAIPDHLTMAFPPH